MSTHALKNFINGQFVESTSDERLDIIDPANEEVYATSPVSTEKDIADAYGLTTAFTTSPAGGLRFTLTLPGA